MHPHVSIVILNWNGRHFLQQFLPSVMSTRYANFKVIVVDNASTDDSLEFLQQQYPQIQIIRLSENFGFAKGYNEGLKQVDSDYYVLLNSDVEVDAGWLDPMVRLLESDKSIAVAQPKILQYHNKELFEYAGAAGGWLDYLGYPFCKGRIFDVCELDRGQYNQVQPIFWASGAAMFIRSSVYREVGGLDEFFFAHQEEIDLCWRIQLAGHKVYSCPSSVVYHVGGGTLPKGNKRKVFLNFRNNLVMMAKNLPAWEAFWKIFYRFQLDAVSAFKSLFAGETTYFVAVVRAHVDFFGWLFNQPQNFRFKGNKKIPLDGYWHKSVVWSHFIKGKKKFSEIVNGING